MNQDRFLCFKELSDRALLWKDGFFSLRSQELTQYGYLFAIADGMGGHNAGEVASSQAIQLLWKQYYSRFKSQVAINPPSAVYPSQSIDPLDRLKGVFYQIHEELKVLSRSKFEYRGMGTTLTAAVLKDGILFWAHIGDSRLYRLDVSKGMEQLTQDHTLTAKGIREGLLNPEDITKDHKGALYQAIAVSPQLNVEVGQRKLSPDEWILLCSDGLTDVLNEKTIEKVCRGETAVGEVQKVFTSYPVNTSLPLSPGEVCKRLMSAADELGREDDVTVIAIKTMNR